MKIGIIGTGLLGSAIATRLLKTGYSITAYNRTKEKARLLETLGASIEESPKKVAEMSDLVIVIVKDVGSVESVSFGNNGVVFGKHDGLVVSNMSTINPISSKKIAQRYLQHNIPMIESPVMGGPTLAEKGRLVVMIGGKRNDYERFRTVFDSIAEKTFFLGVNGTANAMKLAMNLQISLLALSISEGIMLSKKAGLDPLLFLDVLNSTYFKTGMSVLKGPKMARGLFEPSFFLSMMQKDLDEIDYTANEFKANLPAAKLARKMYRNAAREGFGEIDYTGIMAYLEKINR